MHTPPTRAPATRPPEHPLVAYPVNAHQYEPLVPGLFPTQGVQNPAHNSIHELGNDHPDP
eukprot:12402381-Karenia_brevis.AAC.1